MIKRTPTGIPGLDALIEGGFIQGSVNLLTGETGTGKTIFSSQYLWEGLQRGESCVYISLEESPQDIKQDSSLFGWDFEKFEKKGLCKIIYHDPAQVNNLGAVLADEITNMEATRLVIDSTAIMGLVIENLAQIRRRIMNLIGTLKRVGCTSILTSEIPESSKALSRFGVEEFATDSVIILNYLGLGEVSARSLVIRKMRGTNHGKDVYPFNITKHGIVVKKPEL
ncbi:MAG: ATPase domain-containing protein [Candidatus Aenigmatarchaeota archaeon]